MLIDTHSHLYDEAFDDDRAAALARALDNGVEKIMLPAIDSGSHGSLFKLCDVNPGICFPLMGLHPTSVNDNPRWRDEIETVRRLLIASLSGEGRKFYGVGEVGMDLYWSRDFVKEQEEAFRSQMDMAIDYSMPLVIHTREAWKEMRNIISSYSGSVLRVILHSFSGTLDDYRFFCGCGDFLFGIGGPVTYKNSHLAGIIPYMELDRLVLETDSPYLPPVPLRGKRNESSYVVYVRDKVAELMGKSIAEVESVTTANALRIFGIP